MPLSESEVSPPGGRMASAASRRWMVTLVLLAGVLAGFALLLRAPARLELNRIEVLP